MHEGGIATPMIARWPGHIRPNTRTAEVAHIIDFLPTCLELAGTTLPTTFQGRGISPIEGRSFVPVLSGHSRDAHPWLFWELRGARAVRHGKWKLVMDNSRNEWELYDLALDRTETDDLVDRFPERVERMKQAWWQWAKKTNIAKDSRKTTETPGA